MQILCLAEAEQRSLGVAGLPETERTAHCTCSTLLSACQAQSCIGPFELDPITRMSLERARSEMDERRTPCREENIVSSGASRFPAGSSLDVLRSVSPSPWASQNCNRYKSLVSHSRLGFLGFLVF